MKRFSILITLIVLLANCKENNSAWNNETNTFAITDNSGQVLLGSCEVAVRMTDGTLLSSSDERYQPKFTNTEGQTGIYFEDKKGEIDIDFSYQLLDDKSIRTEMEIANMGKESYVMDRMISLVGTVANSAGNPTKILITSEDWQDDKIVYTLEESEQPVESMFTVTLSDPAVAAGFLAGKQHFNHFSISEAVNGVKLEAWGEGNGCELLPGAKRSCDPLFISFKENSLKEMERFAELAAIENNVQLWPENRAVWCTWYAGWNRQKMYDYKEGIAKGISDNIPYVKDYFAERGGGTMRICDDHIAYGDWKDTTRAFPKGLRYTAQEVQQAGLIPGVWYPTYWASTGSDIFEKHPEWMALEEDGSPYMLKDDFQNRSRLQEPYKFSVFDSSLPEVQDYFEKIARKWKESGFRYVTNDFLAFATAPDNYHDKTMSKAQVLRAGLESVKKGLGNKVFYRTIGGQFGTVMGLSNDVRIGGDSHGDRPFAFHRTAASWFYNHRTWINDPSAIVFMRYGEFRDVEWNKMWVSWIALAGTVMTYGEQLDELPQEYIDIYKKVFPPLKVAGRPLDLWENEPYTLWGMQPEANDKGYCLFGVFDLDQEGSTNVRLNLDEIHSRSTGWEYGTEAPEKYLLWDFWNEQLTISEGAKVDLEIAPKSGKLFALRQFTGTPQLLGTNGHFSMGAMETSDLKWNTDSNALSDKVKGNAGEPMTMFLYVPEGYSVKTASLGSEALQTTLEGEVLKLAIPALDGLTDFTVIFDGVAGPVAKRSIEKGSPALWY